MNKDIKEIRNEWKRVKIEWKSMKSEWRDMKHEWQALNPILNVNEDNVNSDGLQHFLCSSLFVCLYITLEFL